MPRRRPPDDKLSQLWGLQGLPQGPPRKARPSVAVNLPLVVGMGLRKLLEWG